MFCIFFTGYLEYKYQLLKLAQSETWSGAWVSLENLLDTKWTLVVTKEDLLFAIIVYHFVNGILEYTAKLYTNDNETISSLLDGKCKESKPNMLGI